MALKTFKLIVWQCCLQLGPRMRLFLEQPKFSNGSARGVAWKNVLQQNTVPVVGGWKHKLALLGELFDYVIPMKVYLCCFFFSNLKKNGFLHFFPHLNIYTSMQPPLC